MLYILVGTVTLLAFPLGFAKQRKNSLRKQATRTALKRRSYVQPALLSQTMRYFEPNEEKHFVVIVPTYNNKRWYKGNLESILNQNYSNFNVIIVDDASPDGTGNLLKSELNNHPQKNKVLLIQNAKRCGALANWYNTIHTYCANKDVVVQVDGDDQLADPEVLALLNKVYQDKNIWLTYGQFRFYPSSKIGWCREAPAYMITRNAFRHSRPLFLFSHLRTFYAGLFKKIKQESFMYQGEYFPTTCDLAMMFPMLEMAGRHHKFIPDVLYLYNTANPINDHKIAQQKQIFFATIIRAMSKYSPLEQAPY